VDKFFELEPRRIEGYPATKFVFTVEFRFLTVSLLFCEGALNESLLVELIVSVDK
jgi:hypothetical protein